MELRHLQYFKTVAEELHFRKAADKLYISQPPLSRQIKELEDELGVILFKRNNKRVELTPAGSYFKKEVDALFARLEESRNRVKQIHESVSGQLRIGYISSTYHLSLISLLKEIRFAFPFVKTKLYEVPTIKQVKALEDGKLDIGILRAPVASEKLIIQTLFIDPFVVVIPKSSAELLDLQQLGAFLKEQPFIFFNQEYAPEYYSKLIEICQRLGFYPDIIHETNNVHSILKLVENGLGVSIVPQSIKDQYQSLNLTFYPLSGIPIATEVVLAYQYQNSNLALRWFVEKYMGVFS